jgi:hypothetical protein
MLLSVHQRSHPLQWKPYIVTCGRGLRQYTAVGGITMGPCAMSESKPELYYDRQSVGQFILVSGTHLAPATNFSHFLIFFFYSFGFVDLGNPLWREIESVLSSFAPFSRRKIFHDALCCAATVMGRHNIRDKSIFCSLRKLWSEYFSLRSRFKGLSARVGSRNSCTWKEK